MQSSVRACATAARRFGAKSKRRTPTDSRPAKERAIVKLRPIVASDATLVCEIHALRSHVRRLLALQQDIVKLTLATNETHIIAQLLRGACESLGYTRAIYFGVNRERGIEARYQIDASDDVEASTVVPNLENDSPFLDALRGESALDGGANRALPLGDARGAYFLGPLRDGSRTFGILYADGGCHAFPLEAAASPDVDASFVATLTTVAAAALVNSARLARATDLAMLEPLTGLLNRRAMTERLAAELERCRTNATSLTYATIDVDDLKAINDSFGHARGDATLKAVGESLLRSSRPGDVVGRMSGDEFAVVFRDVDRELASGLVARLSIELRRGGLRCSVGAAVFPGDAPDGAELAHRADRALYAAKAAGKNRFSFA